jgi:predicted nucleotidyltransferase
MNVLEQRDMRPHESGLSPNERGMTPDQRDLSWIVHRVRSRCEASAIYLFGSYAKQGPHPESDIDLLIVAPSRLPRMRRGRDVAAALAVFPKRFDLLFYTEEELAEECTDPYSFISSVMSSARPLYARGEPTPRELLPPPGRLVEPMPLLDQPPEPARLRGDGPFVEPAGLAEVGPMVEPAPEPARLPEAAPPVEPTPERAAPPTRSGRASAAVRSVWRGLRRRLGG